MQVLCAKKHCGGVMQNIPQGTCLQSEEPAYPDRTIASNDSPEKHPSRTTEQAALNYPQPTETLRPCEADICSKLINSKESFERHRTQKNSKTFKDSTTKSLSSVETSFWHCISILILALFWWLSLLLAIVIKIDDSKGSPIFIQERVGKSNKPFKMYKFRTMYVDTEDRLKELARLNKKRTCFKVKENPRILRSRKMIRKLSLDELP